MSHITLPDLQDAITEAYIDLRNWRAVGQKWGVSGALCLRIMRDGYEPKEPEIRRKLNLPVVIPTPACPDCGAVHTLGVCVAKSVVKVTVIKVTPEELAAIDNPVIVTVKQSIGEKRRRARASINLEDPESAARTISKKMDAQTLAALLALLNEAA